ncbi:hypothetical protein HLV35_01315 [Eggerthellaceae bacterium zg-997]|nr:hypothetical protein [Eggerthellaceae bacterium zg-997]
MYETSARLAWERFAAHLEGHGEGLFLAVSDTPLAQVARDALAGTAEARGFGPDACTFACLRRAGEALSPDDLAFLVEGLDPLALVLCDRAGTDTYRKALACADRADAQLSNHGASSGTSRLRKPADQDDRDGERTAEPHAAAAPATDRAAATSASDASDASDASGEHPRKGAPEGRDQGSAFEKAPELLPRQGFCMALGRPVVAFDDFGSLLSTPALKQQAWALLKRIPARS